ncbi:FMN hydrolase / 5-amino-6-(5-phospho-D-ribitylamino)uracil phosphatase [Gammaproteobacteria bacterium]|nr:MAG: HAD family hydrolase [Gammaproteobacteria bacterium]CAG0939840.1 FMN hydrolase / 5-amino-6-(5-phospho-D-ribitylamino)uracil phosphatase [Gammaproteobacteria bacterium]
MKHIRAICLDLDDTLWDLGPVIGRAEQALQAWFAQRYPRVTARYSIEDIRELRWRIEARFPGREHDLALLRQATFAQVARDCGYPESMGEAAFAAFQQVRNQVTLYADVRPALGRLARRLPLVVLTNGNADLGTIGLRHYFSAVLGAAALGVAKPDPRAFEAVCARLSLRPAEIAHAGDHPQNDVAAARAMGMTAVWVNHGHHAWPDGLAPAEHVVRDLGQLVRLVGA